MVSGATGFRAADVAQKCGRKLVDADSLFGNKDFRSLEEAVFGLDNVVVMARITYDAICDRQDEICDGLKSADDVISVSSGVLRSSSGRYFY